jgi:BirA family transcriptional regulator, biotin operon repressor / biotin---[acetyl-CoA-carboxylase] ligase
VICSPPRLPADYRLVPYDTVGSTNDEAKRLARAGAAPGTVVWALQQTAGRGRRGRRWISPRGNLYASFVLRPDCAPRRASQLGFVAGLAVGDALREVVPDPAKIAYKWPNDILIDGRKIAGLLIESEIGEDGVLSVLVVGIGINLASAPCGTEFPATFVAALGCEGSTPDRMLEVLANHLDGWLRRWRAAGFAVIRDAWLAAAASLGLPIQVRLDDAELHGRFRDIDGEGRLLLETADGMRRISAGEVFPALG